MIQPTNVIPLLAKKSWKNTTPLRNLPALRGSAGGAAHRWRGRIGERVETAALYYLCLCTFLMVNVS